MPPRRPLRWDGARSRDRASLPGPVAGGRRSPSARRTTRGTHLRRRLVADRARAQRTLAGAARQRARRARPISSHRARSFQRFQARRSQVMGGPIFDIACSVASNPGNTPRCHRRARRGCARDTSRSVTEPKGERSQTPRAPTRNRERHEPRTRSRAGSIYRCPPDQSSAPSHKRINRPVGMPFAPAEYPSGPRMRNALGRWLAKVEKKGAATVIHAIPVSASVALAHPMPSLVSPHASPPLRRAARRQRRPWRRQARKARRVRRGA